ncbi:MAG TPA: acetyl-CoA carboxylase carboxyl transferase subunit beta [Ruminococcaceae bacterium]|jgi:acetyl-CoA carboxylase carboxyl transferase subunit beta|nr:acetyl-CoA carboxylase carboxyl transferase subunit beta [Oscillospiraceae bacterium]
MLTKNLFRKPANPLEWYDSIRGKKNTRPDIPEQMCVSCPKCKTILLTGDLSESAHVCPKCGYHFRINARQRIGLIADRDTFRERDAQMSSSNPIDFPNYEKKLWHARLQSGENEAVVCGTASVGGFPCCLFVMDSHFMMGSMGTVVGEKVTRIFEYALQKSLPVIGFTVSGGARMQEGTLSLMQMAKTSAAVKRHSDAGNLYVAVLTDPTTGGVTASFAMEADIVLAEPGALIGFAGPRVIEQTMRKKLPPGFQRAEFLLEKGFLDDVVPRRGQREYLARLLSLHQRRA